MKLRYQMRGLGIGIILTALLMGVATKEAAPLSDAEIRARALELGMIDNDNRKLTDLQGTAPESDTEPTQNEGTVSGGSEGNESSGEDAGLEGNEPSGEDAGSEGNEPSGEDAGSEGNEPSGEGVDPVEDEPTDDGTGLEENEPVGGGAISEGNEPSGENAESGETVAILIEPGLTSWQICLLLDEAGLVEDVDELDRYLCENGYSRSIRSGSYEIAKGTSVEELVKLLTTVPRY